MTDGHARETETPREELSRQLKALFADAGMSTYRIAELLTAKGIQTSQPKVSRTLNGRTAADPEFVSLLLGLIEELSAARRRELVELARDVKAGNRRLVLSRDSAALQRRMAVYFRNAQLSRTFVCSGMPGMAQTEAYVRRVMSEAGAAERLRYQRYLDDTARQFRWIITEGALGFPALLPPDGMVDQLDHLATLSHQPNIAVGIIPWGTPTAEFPIHDYDLFDDEVMVTGGETYGLDLDTPADVAVYASLTDQLERLAVWGDEAHALIETASDRYRRMHRPARTHG